LPLTGLALPENCFRPEKNGLQAETRTKNASFFLVFFVGVNALLLFTLFLTYYESLFFGPKSAFKAPFAPV
jgi:hypothetical protein